jgi:hypothetical protein
MSQKKLVSRNIAIALGIICIILAVGVVGAIAFYIPIINDGNSRIYSLNSRITDADNEISNLNAPHIYTTVLNWTNNEQYDWVDAYGMAFNTGNMTAYQVHVYFTLYIAPHSVDENVEGGTAVAVFNVEAKSFRTLYCRISYSGTTNITDVTVAVYIF